MDMFLRSLLAEPIFLAGLLGFLLENTISGKLRVHPKGGAVSLLITRLPALFCKGDPEPGDLR